MDIIGSLINRSGSGVVLFPSPARTDPTLGHSDRAPPVTCSVQHPIQDDPRVYLSWYHPINLYNLTSSRFFFPHVSQNIPLVTRSIWLHMLLFLSVLFKDESEVFCRNFFTTTLFFRCRLLAPTLTLCMDCESACLLVYVIKKCICTIEEEHWRT